MNRHASPPLSSTSEIKEVVDWSIVTRRSVRGFSNQEVPREVIESILEIASYSASGMNIQPWKVHIVTGPARSRMTARILELEENPISSEALDEPYQYYPREWVSPYIERRRKVGWDLYGLLGIKKGDKAGMHTQHGRNYAFFDAPVGLFFTMERAMEVGSFIDCGMFLQSIMIAARGRNLHTCVQAAFLKYHKLIFEELNISNDHILICGMSLGFADPDRVENTLSTVRESVASFTVFHDEDKEKKI